MRKIINKSSLVLSDLDTTDVNKLSRKSTTVSSPHVNLNIHIPKKYM